MVAPFSEPHHAGIRLETRTDLGEYDSRLRRVMWLFLIPLLLLGGRLWYLQIMGGNEYQQVARNNTIRERTIPPYRGNIFDSRGRVLAENRPSFDVFLTPAIFARDELAMERLRALLSLSDDEVRRIEAAVSNRELRDILVRRDITRDQVGSLETARLELPGIFVQTTPHRHYPEDSLAVHLLGFMGEVSAERLESLSRLGYREGDYIGYVGLEEALEPVLRGQEGLDRFLVNAAGRPLDDDVTSWMLGNYRHIDPIPGRNVVLSIDIELQEIARDAMRNYETGAVVALDPRDGSVLAMVSNPAFDPNAWSGRLSREELLHDINDENTPLFDRSIHAYFPGSTFKIVTAAAALNEGLIGPNDTLHCDGEYVYGGRTFHCNDRGGHGDINIVEALQHSCNVFFYTLGQWLELERLVEYGHAFGFGERPGSGLPNEAEGLVPTPQWLAEHSPEGFQWGQAINVSVGQGDTRTSPLQVALAYAAIANGGDLLYPRLIDRIETAEGDVLFQYPTRVRRQLPLQEEHLGEIVVGLTAAVNAIGGTVYDSRLDYMIVAGKTGTAQTDSRHNRVNGEAAATSAWFAGFAPAQDPQIVIVVFLEHGGGGGRDAAPIGTEIIDRYFREILDWDLEISTALASGNADELEGLMRLNRPGSDTSVEPLDWAEPYLFGTYPDRPADYLIRQWREQR